MFSFEAIGKMLLFFGIFIILFGLLFMSVGKIPFLGKLPGDIEIHKKGLDIYFPLATSLIISFMLTIILNVIFRYK